MRLSPDGATLYVTNFMGDKITIVNTATNKIDGEITGLQQAARDLGHRRRQDALRGEQRQQHHRGGRPGQARHRVDDRRSARTRTARRCTPDGQLVYAGNLGDNSLSVIDVASRSVVATITGFKEPRQAIVFTRDGKTAYVLNEDLGIAKVDMASNRVEATLAAPAAKMQKAAP